MRTYPMSQLVSAKAAHDLEISIECSGVTDDHPSSLASWIMFRKEEIRAMIEAENFSNGAVIDHDELYAPVVFYATRNGQPIDPLEFGNDVEDYEHPLGFFQFDDPTLRVDDDDAAPLRDKIIYWDRREPLSNRRQRRMAQAYRPTHANSFDREVVVRRERKFKVLLHELLLA